MTEAPASHPAPPAEGGDTPRGSAPPPPKKAAKAKGGGDSGPDPDAWMVTFSDLLNLLMTFFVLIFATQDPVKEKLQEAFGQSAGVFGLFRRSFIENITAVPRVEISQERLQALLDELGATDIDIQQEERGLVVTLPSDTYFDPGSSRLSERGRVRVTALAQYLRFSTHRIRLEGHTDNREYSSATYASGYELSLARAHSVLLEMGRQQVAENRLSLVGYGPSRRKFSNDSRIGRARNRRVEIVIQGLLE